MISINFYKNFSKKLEKISRKDQEKVKQRLILFLKNCYDPTLNNHALRGKYLDYRSINITADLRAIYKRLAEEEVIFVDIDTHSNLYS